MYRFQFIVIFLILFLQAFSQQPGGEYEELPLIDYKRQREYVIGGIEITGVKYLQPNVLTSISGLSTGQKINVPGDAISKAIDNYWKHGLFSDVKIIAQKIEDGVVFLEIVLAERPRIEKVIIEGLNRSQTEDIQEKINLRRGSQVTDNILNNTSVVIKKHFVEKGFLNTEVDIIQKDDTSSVNRVNLIIRVDKNERVKIDEIIFQGNEVFPDKRLRRVMKNTKQRNLNIFKSSKFIESDYNEDIENLIKFYNENGYRDAIILGEKTIRLNEKRIGLKIELEEGNQYFIRNISWVGNTKYPGDFLDKLLGVNKGDVYNQTLLEERLEIDEDAITSYYMDQGYLFFNANPVETNIENDSIDLEIQIYEGKQARINEIIIRGNTKTNEHVIRRELYTYPGDLFSRTALIRSVRQLANLGHFNPETISPNPIPNQSDGTVDIEYQLEERANDQLEISGGWGGYVGFVGTVGVRFSNFSARNLFNGRAWRPIPSGDGQTLQVKAQSNGRFYQGYNISFIEPWFGGKKPNSFSVSLYHTVRRYPDYYGDEYENSYFKTYGMSVGLGRRLKWPDDYFTLYNDLSFQRYNLNEYGNQFVFDNGISNILSFKTALSRSSQDQNIYPRKGSNISLSLQLTPPYSLMQTDKDYSNMSTGEKYRLIEFHKWLFKGSWYTSLAGNLVLATRTEFGYLGHYNNDIGPSPFEKFDVGGSGLVGYNLYGTDIIALRGYEEGALTPYTIEQRNGSTQRIDNGNIYTRYYMELRYPVSLNPSATIYGLAFIEGGNSWVYFEDFNPFSIKRSAGVGIRAFLPMFGLLGIDWAYGFDPAFGKQNVSGPQFHFTMGQQF